MVSRPMEWKADEEKLGNGITVYRQTLFDGIGPEEEILEPWRAIFSLDGTECGPAIAGQGKTRDEALIDLGEKMRGSLAMARRDMGRLQKKIETLEKFFGESEPK